MNVKLIEINSRKNLMLFHEAYLWLNFIKFPRKYSLLSSNICMFIEKQQGNFIKENEIINELLVWLFDKTFSKT